jgi:hypothetical protein
MVHEMRVLDKKCQDHLERGFAPLRLFSHVTIDVLLR